MLYLQLSVSQGNTPSVSHVLVTRWQKKNQLLASVWTVHYMEKVPQKRDHLDAGVSYSFIIRGSANPTHAISFMK